MNILRCIVVIFLALMIFSDIEKKSKKNYFDLTILILTMISLLIRTL